MAATTRDEPLARLQALAEEQAALRRVATLAASDPEPSLLFECVCEELGRVLGVESTDMLRFGGGGEATIVAAWAASGAPSFPVGSSVPVAGETVTGKLHRSGRPQRVDDYAGVEGELASRLRGAGIRSAVGAPIHVAGRLWGAIMAVSGRPSSFPADTEQRIADFAELVTAALASVDAREQLAASRARIVEAGYEERRRLGRDLHDGAQQQLVTAALNLRLAQGRLEGDPGQARELVDTALEQLQAGIRDLRELGAGIHPSILTDRGLAAALEALARRCPLPVELETVDCEGLPGPVATTAYFVVAEALTNAAKHARADGAEVSVRAGDGWAAVEIRDDGVGGADASAGSGLRGLSDRVSALGGELEVESSAGGGTAVRARIALPAAGESGARDGGHAPNDPAGRAR